MVKKLWRYVKPFSSYRNVTDRRTNRRTDGRTYRIGISISHIGVRTRNNNHPIFMKVCQQRIFNWMNVTWSKMKKIALDRIRVRQNVFLVSNMNTWCSLFWLLWIICLFVWLSLSDCLSVWDASSAKLLNWFGWNLAWGGGLPRCCVSRLVGDRPRGPAPGA